ncbi:hypothetical protein A2U01_0087219, partial [Trifolium medium]|nr:hypothetical protein [Trifolium medium]
EEAGPSRRGPDKRKERQSPKQPKPPPSKFTGYTPLNAPRERILAEVSSANFKKACIRYPKQLPIKANIDRGKYCRYHRGYGH